MNSLLAALAISRHRAARLPAADEVPPLLASGCRLLVLTPRSVVSAASASVPISSLREGHLLAVAARELASQFGLVATVTVTGDRFRVRFSRPETSPELPLGGE